MFETKKNISKMSNRRLENAWKDDLDFFLQRFHKKYNGTE